MAEKNNGSNITNGSYENCINRLQARYNGRGVVVNAANERVERQSRENCDSPNAYFIAHINNGSVSEKYKNGEFNGQKYMTTGDFLKYYSNHKEPTPASMTMRRPAPITKEFAKPNTEVKAETYDAVPAAASRKAAEPVRRVKRFDPKADTIVMPAAKEQTKVKSRVAKLFKKWFPNEVKSEKKAEIKKNIPVAAIGLLISVSVAMTLIVSTTVMASDSRTALSDVKYEIKQLTNEELRLEEELVKRDDLAMISEYAQNKLGMIRRDYISASYMEISEENSVNGNVDDHSAELAALLSAMFGN